MQTHLIETTVRCGAPVGLGSQYREKVTCPACLAAKDPFELMRRFAEGVRPIPDRLTMMDDADWREQVAKIEEEMMELTFALLSGPPTNPDELLHHIEEINDLYHACAMLLLWHGVDPEKMLTVTGKYNHFRAAHGIENGHYTHDEATKRELKREMYAEFLAVAWRKGQ